MVLFKLDYRKYFGDCLVKIAVGNSSLEAFCGHFFLQTFFFFFFFFFFLIVCVCVSVCVCVCVCLCVSFLFFFFFCFFLFDWKGFSKTVAEPCMILLYIEEMSPGIFR